MVCFNNPATFIPANNSVRIVEGLNRFFRDKEPLQTFLARRRIDFPDSHDPNLQRRETVVSVFLLRRSDLDRSEGSSCPWKVPLVAFLAFGAGTIHRNHLPARNPM